MQEDHISAALTADEIAQRYRQRMAACFGEALMAPAEWTHADADFSALRSDYYELWKNQPGGHKKYSYFPLYDRLFGPFRARAARLLEIGVYRGASLRTWRAFLGEGSRVVGIDINPECQQHEDAENACFVRIGDQSSVSFLDAVAAEFGPFDLIIDDGSHRTDHQIASFNALFPAHLAAGGVYFVEDSNTSCWPEYRAPGPDALDLAHAAALATHYFYTEHHYKDYERAAHPRAFRTIAAAKLIEEVRIVEAGVAIFKARADYHPPLVDHR